MANLNDVQQSDGGPAFPVPGFPNDPSFNGMTLRDHFAEGALLMAYYCESSSPTHGGTPGNPTYAGIAERAYLMADAMLKARAGGAA
jgi:hypothetical protein